MSNQADVKRIKILGTGCPKCQQLAENAKAAADQLGVECDIKKISEISEIMKFGVMMTPGFVVEGKVRSSGKVLNVEQIKSMLQQG